MEFCDCVDYFVEDVDDVGYSFGCIDDCDWICYYQDDVFLGSFQEMIRRYLNCLLGWVK